MSPAHGIPIKGFIETSFVDWAGKLCSVLFFPRCNFRCRYCHNPDLVLRPEAIKDIELEWILQRLDGLKGWIDGVCVTGGEPTLQPGLVHLLDSLKTRGFLVKLDTNGSNPGMLRALIASRLVDHVAMDVKASLDESSYCNIIQTPDMLGSVKESIKLLLQGSVSHEFRCTVLPALHSPEEIYRLAAELNGAAQLRIQNFRPTKTIDPGLDDAQPYSEIEIATMQREVNRLIALS